MLTLFSLIRVVNTNPKLSVIDFRFLKLARIISDYQGDSRSEKYEGLYLQES